MFMKQQIEEIVQKRIEHIEKQRAELLEALKDTVCALECCGKDYPAMTKGRAAITRAAAQIQLDKDKK